MESPFHIATPWPRGVELLLKFGGETSEGILNMPNAFQESPLDYALQVGQLSSVELLLNANAEIDLESTINVETAGWRNSDMPQIDEIITLLCETLRDRRKKMLRLALEWLPDYTIARLGLMGQEMLQDSAFEVSEALRSQMIHLPPWFGIVRPGSIYLSAFLSMNLAQTLLSVGFRSLDATFHGFTPLMTVDLQSLVYRRDLESTVDLVTWFISHGENLHASIPVSALMGIPNQLVTPCLDFKIIHRVAEAYGNGLYPCRLKAEDDSRLGHMRGIINDPSMDPCICYCSLKGCTPATLFMRSFLHSFFWRIEPSHDLNTMNEHDLRTMHEGIELMSILLSNDRAHDIAVDVIRVSTLQRLGMKHTCCRYKRKVWGAEQDSVTHAILAGQYKIIDVMDPREVAEIQEEDRHLAVRLEALVEEFTAKYDEKKTSFHDFFFGYWWKRMDQIDEEEEEICADDLEKIQEIGVVLDKTE